MGVVLDMVDHDEAFRKIDVPHWIVNDFRTSNPADFEKLSSELISRYDADVIDEGASCACQNPKISRSYNVGMTCPICSTQVMYHTDRAMRSTLWIRAPEGTLGLISPVFWTMASRMLTISKFNLLEWLCNTKVQLDPTKPMTDESRKNFRKIEAKFHDRRGLNNFITHFREIMSTIVFETTIIEKRDRDDFWQYVKAFEPVLFPKHIGIPSKRCVVVEHTNSGIYFEKLLKIVLEAVWTVTTIRTSVRELSSEEIQNRTVKAISEIASFYPLYGKKHLYKKPGMFRKHTFGGRLNMSGRGVITSITGPHHRKDLHLPWGMAVQLFKYHIINKYRRRHQCSPIQALAFVYEHVLRYNREMDEILQELIREAPGRGPAVTLGRNSR